MSNLDSYNVLNYRPNLNNISNILEKLFIKRLQPHILTSANFNTNAITLLKQLYSALSIMSTIPPTLINPLFSSL